MIKIRLVQGNGFTYAFPDNNHRSQRSQFKTLKVFSQLFSQLSVIAGIVSANETMHKTDCMAYCNCKNAKMVDADIVTQSKTYMYFLKYSHDELLLHLNIIFDFSQKKWINEISKAELDTNLWFKKDKIFPNYPIMNDLLGKWIHHLI